WTPRRKGLLAELLGEPFESLVAILDRQLGVRGPIAHPEGGLWASADDVSGALLVENLETFRTLAVLAEQSWLVLHVPGGPPPAECQLIERIAALAPQLRFHAVVDLDPPAFASLVSSKLAPASSSMPRECLPPSCMLARRG
ncbi:MAG TPA: hypothetical protein VNV37_07260, partial [Solirubrobacteraceae bacterium]|nr:hypothetical protein [Solirubrobacteraceae bacterium]